MFGSDQMVSPGALERLIAVIEEAPFLSKQQKREFFYSNAARFFVLMTNKRRGTKTSKRGSYVF
jgi:predicted TIM-barrel fold metal-dependent hydrolase